MLTNIWSTHKDINGASRASGANTQVYTPQLTPQTPWVDILVVMTLGPGTWHWLISHGLPLSADIELSGTGATTGHLLYVAPLAFMILAPLALLVLVE